MSLVRKGHGEIQGGPGGWCCPLIDRTQVWAESSAYVIRDDDTAVHLQYKAASALLNFGTKDEDIESALNKLTVKWNALAEFIKEPQ